MKLEDQLSELAVTKLRTYRRMASRILFNVNDAEDAVQDAFLAAYRNLDKFEGKSQLSSWVGRIVINCALMKCRRGKRKLARKFEPLDDMKLSELPRITPDIVSQIDRKRQHWALLKAIPSLPNCFRRVVVYRLEGLQFKEIAAKLDNTKGTMKSHYSRAKDRLAERMNP